MIKVAISETFAKHIWRNSWDSMKLGDDIELIISNNPLDQQKADIILVQYLEDAFKLYEKGLNAIPWYGNTGEAFHIIKTPRIFFINKSDEELAEMIRYYPKWNFRDKYLAHCKKLYAERAKTIREAIRMAKEKDQVHLQKVATA